MPIVERLASTLHLGTLVPLGVSLLAVVISYWTARIQNRTVVTSLFLDFNSRYNSAEMRQAMLDLGAFGLRSPSEEFARSWLQAFNSGDPEARRLDGHRRLINRYYSDLIRLHRHRYVDRRFVVMCGRHYAVNVYYRVVQPMNAEMFAGELQIPEFDQDARELRKIVKGFGNGLLSGEQPTIRTARTVRSSGARRF